MIRDHKLSPRLVQIERGDLVAWISRSKTPSEIVFEREVAAKMTCHGVVNFVIEGDELRSAPIHPGEVASFCELSPGRYHYRVVRADPTLATAGGTPARLEGLIVVGEN